MKRWTIGILTPFVDGNYYGDVMWGLSREAKLHEVRLVSYITYLGDHSGNRIPYSVQVGWDLPDAWIIVADAVTMEYANELAVRTGKPIIAIANQPLDGSAYTIQCDNRGSMRAATEHLVSLGHARIAFIGDPGNSDLLERFEGYRDALKDAGLPYDEKLHRSTWSGGEAAAYYAAIGMPCTAIVAGTDTIAIDLIQQLQERGYRIPEDLAVVGFDDIGAASKCEPSLTTVRQPTIDMGSIALRRAVEVLAGVQQPLVATRIPAKLIVRESSGSGVVDLSPNDQTLSSKPLNEANLEQMVEAQHLIGRSVINADDLSWLRSTNQHWGCLALWMEESGTSEHGKSLVIDRATSLNGDPLPELGERVQERQFPPLDMLPIMHDRERADMAIVQVVYNDTQFLGFIVTVGPINDRLLRGFEIRKMPNLLGVIHERRVLLADLQAREASNSALLSKLEIVSRTSNDGVMEIHLGEGRIEWIAGIEHILGIPREGLPTSVPDFIALLHPEDFPRVREVWRNHLQDREPYEVEFRLRSASHYVWVFTAGEAIFQGEAPVRLIASITDIHSRKQAESALLASEEKYRDFFNHMPIMILSLDEAFLITDANPNWLEAMGCKLEQVVGRDCIDYLTAESGQRWTEQWRNNESRAEGAMDMELQWVTANGRIIEGLVNCKYFADLDGHRTYLTVRDVTDRKIAERQIHELAYQDPLTGLANRRFFYEELERAIVLAQAERGKFAMMMIDLDHFKIVNDSLGHDVGDRLLYAVADVIRSEVDGSGLVSRIGGDEFMVLITDAGHAGEVEALAERILMQLQQPFELEGQSLYITASVGLSWYPANGTELTELVKMADTAMYRAKQQGRNRKITYSASMGHGVSDQLALGNKLRRAAQDMSEFRLYYQPQYDMQDGRMIGVEALIRWVNPEWGMIPPDQFIPLAEDNGLIVPIGEWVMAEACRQLKLWEETGQGGLIMSLNISGKQLQQADFLAMVDRIVTESGVDPRAVCFEITETTALRNMEMSSAVLNELLQRGFLIALDDFGTGYSSLSVLNRLPLRVIKIDRSFVSGMESNEQNTAIIMAILAMSRSLKLAVLAEGVETDRQLQLLKTLGCDAYQGYLKSRPLPPEELEQLWAGSNWQAAGQQQSPFARRL
jgi:diguanylate cyclase (GGDEF)-like protein/PAS domain S-box-containing protein